MTADPPPVESHPFSEKEAQELVVRIVRMEMVRRGIGYRELQAALAEIGVDIDERALRNKVARGTFSAAFLAQICHALRMDKLQVWQPSDEQLRRAARDAPF